MLKIKIVSEYRMNGCEFAYYTLQRSHMVFTVKDVEASLPEKLERAAGNRVGFWVGGDGLGTLNGGYRDVEGRERNPALVLHVAEETPRRR